MRTYARRSKRLVAKKKLPIAVQEFAIVLSGEEESRTSSAPSREAAERESPARECRIIEMARCESRQGRHPCNDAVPSQNQHDPRPQVRPEETTMLNKMKLVIIGVAVAILSTPALSQTRTSRIGDDYARAALRAIIYTTQSGITVQRISALLNEADVEASTPAEEASLKELNRILGEWIGHPNVDRQNCFLALKVNLKARNGETPEACK